MSFSTKLYQQNYKNENRIIGGLMILLHYDLSFRSEIFL
jgi:hypothetical protein